MSSDARGRLATTASILAILPGVASAQTLDPSVVVDASALARAGGSFVLVLTFGVALVYLAEEFVDGSVDASMDSPLQSVGYGLAALVVVGFFGVYAISQLAGVSDVAVGLATVALGVFVLALAGLGFTVVGARLTGVGGERRLRLGAAVGATISALVWFAPSFGLALSAWILLASVGVGGPTERWIHASRSVDPETVPEN